MDVFFRKEEEFSIQAIVVRREPADEKTIE